MRELLFGVAEEFPYALDIVVWDTKHFECFHKLLTQNYYNVTLGMGAKYV